MTSRTWVTFFSPSGVYDHLMTLERSEAAGLQGAQNERLEELRAKAATLRAKGERIRAETAAIKVRKESLYKRFQLTNYLICLTHKSSPIQCY